ncbi:hypothetical protein T4C_5011 [Trichinella pseudospiralis]|uniref:Uncharacterized protein n=1 Tax=Trichinella pseudospiralis TaxID=6337 RepID=A0A0V1FQE6_TRIPS|nr:hypothetical protein T4D_15007 [Trichinella pseudospiralis]KRZ26501.1 hypothetical protein T4C_5011 [Trichinella pseudospiralis]
MKCNGRPSEQDGQLQRKRTSADSCHRFTGYERADVDLWRCRAVKRRENTIKPLLYRYGDALTSHLYHRLIHQLPEANYRFNII